MYPFPDPSHKRRRFFGIALIALAVIITASAIFYVSASWRMVAADINTHTTSSGNMLNGASSNSPYATPTSRYGAASKVGATGTPTRTPAPKPTTIPTMAPTVGSTPTTIPPTPVPTSVPTMPPTATPTSGTGSGSSSSWQLIYSDDFNGTTLNSTWGVYNGPHTGGQNYYSPSEVSVSNGMLHLAMEQKTTNGLPYTTGGVAAFGLAQTYGRYVFRAKLPLGKGVGPYTILWPQTATDNVQTDLFESPPPTKNEIFFTNHGGPGGTATQLTAMNDFGNNFHVFDYQWTPGKITLTIDGVYIGALTVDIPNQPMWFGMAVATGDAFTGLPDGTTVLPVTFDIDWVQIYKYVG